MDDPITRSYMTLSPHIQKTTGRPGIRAPHNNYFLWYRGYLCPVFLDVVVRFYQVILALCGIEDFILRL